MIANETPMLSWTARLLQETAAIRKTVETLRKSQWKHFDFINRFRRRIMPDLQINLHPEVGEVQTHRRDA